MSIGDLGLTGVTKEQAETMPGMAYMAGTGPHGKTCGDCKFKGFSYQGRERVSQKTGEIYYQTHRSNGCEKNYELLGKKRPGADIPDRTKACKYFEQRAET